MPLHRQLRGSPPCSGARNADRSCAAASHLLGCEVTVEGDYEAIGLAFENRVGMNRQCAKAVFDWCGPAITVSFNVNLGLSADTTCPPKLGTAFALAKCQ
jgi:hypothetical protein